MLSREDFYMIKQMRKQCVYIVDIATQMGCSERTVRRYLKYVELLARKTRHKVAKLKPFSKCEWHDYAGYLHAANSTVFSSGRYWGRYSDVRPTVVFRYGTPSQCLQNSLLVAYSPVLQLC